MKNKLLLIIAALTVLSHSVSAQVWPANALGPWPVTFWFGTNFQTATNNVSFESALGINYNFQTTNLTIVLANDTMQTLSKIQSGLFNADIGSLQGMFTGNGSVTNGIDFYHGIIVGNGFQAINFESLNLIGTWTMNGSNIVARDTDGNILAPTFIGNLNGDANTADFATTASTATFASTAGNLTTVSTNLITKTNDSRSLVLTNAANQFAGTLNGSATTISGTIPSTQVSGLGTVSTLSSNQVVQGLPFVVLHNNLTATVFTNGYFNGSPTIYSFPSSTTAGFNEVQAMFSQKTNSPYAGFRMMIDSGLYRFTTQLIISNRCIIQGAGTAGTIFRYVGSTNFATMQQITNCLAGGFGDQCAQRTAPYSLLYCSTNSQNAGGIESWGTYNVNVSDLSIQTSTNMFCFGVSINGGDYTRFENVAVGGPEMWTTPSYYNEFIDGSLIPEPSKMIGFVIGGNQPSLDHCRVFAVADGLVALGDSFLTLNDFNAVALDYSGADGASPYPATSELSLNSGILLPKISQCEFLSINHILFFDCWNDFYIGSAGAVHVTEMRDQNAPNFPDNFEIWRDAGSYPPVQIDATKDLVSVMAFTNDADSGFYQNVSANAYVCENVLAGDGGLEFYDGQNSFLGSSRTALSWSGVVGNDVQAASGKKFIGNGITVTNVLGTSIVSPYSTKPVAVTVGVSPFTFSNSTPSRLEIYITDTAAFSVTKNGTAIASSLTSDSYFILQATNVCVITYASTTPTMNTNAW